MKRGKQLGAGERGEKSALEGFCADGTVQWGLSVERGGVWLRGDGCRAGVGMVDVLSVLIVTFVGLLLLPRVP